MNTFTQDDFTDCQVVGFGGEGSVFKATTKTFGLVAVKVFNSNQPVNIREIENMRKFSHHPNIVQFFGVYVENHKLSHEVGFVMKYMPLGSVHNAIHVAKVQYSIESAYSWILQAARAIAYLHDNDVIHRDIKPANMLLSDSMKHVKVGDFGLAKVNKRHSQTNFQGSTYLYTSPEMFKDCKSYNTATDVFSFAISIWEIVTKRVPYDHKPETSNSLVLMDEVISGTRPSLNSLFNLSLTELLKRAWSSNSMAHQRPKMNEIVSFFEEKQFEKPCKDILNVGDEKVDSWDWRQGDQSDSFIAENMAGKFCVYEKHSEASGIRQTSKTGLKFLLALVVVLFVLVIGAACAASSFSVTTGNEPRNILSRPVFTLPYSTENIPIDSGTTTTPTIPIATTIPVTYQEIEYIPVGPHPEETKVWEAAVNDKDATAKQLIGDLTDLVRDYKRREIVVDNWSPFTFTFSIFNELTQEQILEYMRKTTLDIDKLLHLPPHDVAEFYESIFLAEQ